MLLNKATCISFMFAMFGMAICVSSRDHHHHHHHDAHAASARSDIQRLIMQEITEMRGEKAAQARSANLLYAAAADDSSSSSDSTDSSDSSASSSDSSSGATTTSTTSTSSTSTTSTTTTTTTTTTAAPTAPTTTTTTPAPTTPAPTTPAPTTTTPAPTTPAPTTAASLCPCDWPNLLDTYCGSKSCRLLNSNADDIQLSCTTPLYAAGVRWDSDSNTGGCGMAEVESRRIFEAIQFDERETQTACKSVLTSWATTNACTIPTTPAPTTPRPTTASNPCSCDWPNLLDTYCGSGVSCQYNRESDTAANLRCPNYEAVTVWRSATGTGACSIVRDSPSEIIGPAQHDTAINSAACVAVMRSWATTNGCTLDL